MFTAPQCLDKAMELERRAGDGLPQDVADDYRDMALQWRRLAARARVQDRRQPRPPSSGNPDRIALRL